MDRARRDGSLTVRLLASAGADVAVGYHVRIDDANAGSEDGLNHLRRRLVRHGEERHVGQHVAEQRGLVVRRVDVGEQALEQRGSRFGLHPEEVADRLERDAIV